MAQGAKTGMPRTALPRDSARAEAVVWAVALAIAVVFAVGQIITVLAVAPAAIAYHETNGGAPAFVEMASSLGPFLLAGLLALIDALIFGLFVWLARRYWIGFAYLPPVIYLGLGSIVVWLLVSGVVSSLASGT